MSMIKKSFGEYLSGYILTVVLVFFAYILANGFHQIINYDPSIKNILIISLLIAGIMYVINYVLLNLVPKDSPTFKYYSVPLLILFLVNMGIWWVLLFEEDIPLLVSEAYVPLLFVSFIPFFYVGKISYTYSIITPNISKKNLYLHGLWIGLFYSSILASLIIILNGKTLIEYEVITINIFVFILTTLISIIGDKRIEYILKSQNNYLDVLFSLVVSYLVVYITQFLFIIILMLNSIFDARYNQKTITMSIIFGSVFLVAVVTYKVISSMKSLNKKLRK